MIDKIEEMMGRQSIFMEWHMNSDSLYGVKTTSILVVDKNNKAIFREITYKSSDKSDKSVKEMLFELSNQI